MKTITVATFDTEAQALPLKHRLEELHINARLHTSKILKQLWFVHKHRAEVKIDVDEVDYDKSVQVMRELESATALSQDAVHCPMCHSSRVDYPQFTKKFFLPNLIGLLAGLGLVEKKYYCEDCHHTWSPADRPQPKPRDHMAPNYFLEEVPPKTPPSMAQYEFE